MPVFRSNTSPPATVADVSDASEMQNPFNDEADMTTAKAFEIASQAGHRSIHPLHVAFALLYRAEDIRDVSDIPRKPILDIPLFWTILSKTQCDPNNIGEMVRKKLIGLTEDQSGSHEISGISYTDSMEKALKRALSYRKSRGDKFVAPHHILRALFDDADIEEILKMFSLRKVDLIKLTEELRSKKVLTQQSQPKYALLNKYADDITERASRGAIDPVLCRDEEIYRLICILSRRGKNNAVLIGEPGVGKSAVIEGLALRIVDRERGNLVPQNLNGRIFSLDLGRLIAGTTCHGQYEERVEKVLAEVERNEDSGNHIILFIDEFHLIVTGKGEGGKGGMDAANLFKPMLARGKLHCVGATTSSEYDAWISKDGSLERRFAQVWIEEPTVAQTKTILRGVSGAYERHHRVRILDKAIITAAELARRYLTTRRLPDSAIDLIDEACAMANVNREMRPEDIDAYEWQKTRLETNIQSLKREKDEHSRLRIAATEKGLANIDDQLMPLRRKYQAEKEAYQEAYQPILELGKQIQQLKEDQALFEQEVRIKDLRRAERLLDLKEKDHRHRIESMAFCVSSEDIANVLSRWTSIPTNEVKPATLCHLAKMVVGQPEAVNAVTNAIQMSRLDLANPSCPISSLLFVGPSGCGKTFLAKMLASLVFKSPDCLVKIDGSDYSDSIAVTRLIGTPNTCTPFDQIGELTEFVRRKPYCVVLIDEAEKVCMKVMALFLQVLEDGRLTDGCGRTIDFRNCFIIFTTNDRMSHLAESEEEKRDLIIKELFPLEFVNRLDDVIFFRKLSPLDLESIMHIRLREITERMKEKDIELLMDDDAKWGLWQAIEGATDARDLDRSFSRIFVSPLSAMLLHHAGGVTRMKISVDDSGVHVAIV